MQDLCHLAAVDRTCAPKGVERHVAWVLASLTKVCTSGVSHVLVHNLVNTPGHLLNLHPEALGRSGQSTACSLDVESHLSTEEIARIQIT